jgi:HPt (histidine-containing phosphotransfer) domain-containing protein
MVENSSGLDEGDAPPFDITKAHERLMLPKELMRSFLSDFRDMYSSIVNDIEKLLSDGQTENAGDLIHTFKGVSGTLGITEVYKVVEALELAFLDGRDKDVTANLELLDGRMTSLLVEINQYLSEFTPG